MKNGLEILLERFWKLPKFFLEPRRLSKSARGAILGGPNVLLRALGFQVVFRTALGSKKVPQEASGTLKIKVFVWTVCEF